MPLLAASVATSSRPSRSVFSTVFVCPARAPPNGETRTAPTTAASATSVTTARERMRILPFSGGPRWFGRPRRVVRTSDLPGAVAEDGHGISVERDAVYRELWAADHEVDVHDTLVDACLVGVVVHGMLVAAAERDVRGRVLVDQGVVEDALKRPDAAFAVDERDLAEA